MKTNTELMYPERYYHIYNRGNNGEQLFKQERNYVYFLKKYAQYIEPIACTFAYVLMGNHFHFFVKIKTEAEIRQFLPAKTDTPIPYVIGQQFSKLFNTFVQAINKQENRTGSLLEDTFRRIPVGSEAYAAQLVYYIHYNPQKHRFVKDFTQYPHSSYHAFLREGFTRLPREQVFEWFGGKAAFLAYHGKIQDIDGDWYKKNWIEFD